MIIEVFLPDRNTFACQAIVCLSVPEKRVRRALLEGLVRELVELHLHRILRSQSKSLDGEGEVSQLLVERATPGLAKDLAHRGFVLENLTVRALAVDQNAAGYPDSYAWVEFIVPDLATRDGFTVGVDMVAQVRANHDGAFCKPSSRRLTKAALADAILASAGGLGLEDFLGRRDRWMAETQEICQEILDVSQLHLSFLAVTDLQVSQRKDAFVPPPLLGWERLGRELPRVRVDDSEAI